MNDNTCLEFFSHETDINQLKYKLRVLYGVHCAEPTSPLTVEKIYEVALDLCDSLGATDHSYFAGWFRHSVREKLLSYLATDALFHIRKEQNQGKYHSLSQFINENCAVHITDTGNYSKLVREEFMNSVLPDLWNIERQQHTLKSSYLFPHFMEKLLFLLVDTVKKNPYGRLDKTTVNFRSLNTFLGTWFYSKLRGLYPDDIGDRLIAAYIAERFFDVDTATYLVEKISQTEYQLNANVILAELSSVFLVPNIFDRRAYCDVMFDVLAEKRETLTRLEHLIVRPDVLARVKQTQTPIQIQESNLKHCVEYMRFMATVYFPALNTCFYVLLRQSFAESSKADKVLLDYLAKQDLDSWYQNRDRQWSQRLNSFKGKQKDYICRFYSVVKETIYNKEAISQWSRATSLDYLSAESPYQKAILEAIIKEKLDF